MRPTFWPAAWRARARLAATVDLPTPPLPLATARRFLTPGRAIFCGCAGFMRFLFSWRHRQECLCHLIREFSQCIHGVDAGGVAVVSGNLIGVVTDRLHGGRFGGAGGCLLWGEHTERVGGLRAFFDARRARAARSQLPPRYECGGPVAPVDFQTVPFALEGERLHVVGHGGIIGIGGAAVFRRLARGATLPHPDLNG